MDSVFTICLFISFRMPNFRNFDLMLKVVCSSLLGWAKTMQASYSTPAELVSTRSCFGLIYCFWKTFYNLVNEIWGLLIFFLAAFTHSNSVRSSCVCVHFARVQIFLLGQRISSKKYRLVPIRFSVCIVIYGKDLVRSQCIKGRTD